MLQPGADLSPLARAALREQDLDESRDEEALDLVRRVTAAPLWSRARAGSPCLTEVPLQYVETIDDLPTLVRGVIDLVFREGGGGWVIVDYKTDDRPGEDLDGLVEHYAPQVRAYAAAWTRMVGQPVSEAGLFFVRSGTYRTVADPAGAPAHG